MYSQRVGFIIDESLNRVALCYFLNSANAALSHFTDQFGGILAQESAK